MNKNKYTVLLYFDLLCLNKITFEINDNKQATTFIFPKIISAS